MPNQPAGTASVPPPLTSSPQPMSRWRGKAWLLLAIPLGFTTWAAFLYVGIRARRPRWLGWAAVYGAMLAGYLVLDAPAHPGGTAESIAAGLAILTWIGGGVHAVVISSDAVSRIGTRNDPAMDAARQRIAQRAQGRRLLATQPELAREVGVGRPDLTDARDYGLVDINHCPAAVIARLPGMTAELASQIAAKRGESGGFSSVEDLGLLLDLPLGTVDALRDLTVFVPG
jgi:DNA uptake protein ComE-like DNA-binding protein